MDLSLTTRKATLGCIPAAAHSTARLPGRGMMGTVDVVFGVVVRIRIRDDAMLPSGKLDMPKIAPIARRGYDDYCVVRKPSRWSSQRSIQSCARV